MERFHHDPLDLTRNEIRLLQFLPRQSETERLRCDIITFDVDDCPEYCALSYTWGPSAPTVDILIGNQLCSIRKNLHDFLTEHVENSTLKIDFIWIDQLCIDQESILERNHQVETMADIFQRASYVIAWLGAQTRYTTNALFEARSSKGPVDVREMNDSAWAKFYGHMGYFNWQVKLARIMKSALDQAYWRRLWVVQELRLARAFFLVFGDIVIRHFDGKFLMAHATESDSGKGLGSPLSQALYGWHDSPEFLTLSFHGARMWTLENWPPPGQSGPFWDLSRAHCNWLDEAMIKFGSMSCQVPHDKVYGLLGLVPMHARVSVDYSKAASCVFWEAIIASEALESNEERITDSDIRALMSVAHEMGVTGYEHEASHPLALQYVARISDGRTPPKVFRNDV